MATHFHQLAVKDIRKETPDCISVSFHIPPGLEQTFAFTQGQNITIKTIVDGEELRRSYSICSSPLDKELRIAVKKVSGGKFSAWANSQLNAGTILAVLPPTGKFYTTLSRANKKHYVAFAAGSGITPLLSIIKTTLLTEPGSHFTLVYANKNRAAVIFKEALEALKNRFMNRFSIHHIFSREKMDTAINNGRINNEKCDILFQHLINLQSCDDFFLCGPEAMIFCVKDYLEQKGVEKNKIHFELFTVPGKNNLVPEIATAQGNEMPADKNSDISVKVDGAVVNFALAYNGEAILDAALQLGTDLPFACKGGVCASCRAKLVTGEVFMDTNYALEPEEIKKGYILTCQAHPRSAIVFIDFDYI